MKEPPMLLDEFELAEEQPPAPSPAARSAVIGFALLCLGFHFLSEQSWIPLLDSANLALHEAGHPLVGLFSDRLMVYGGTLFQLAFPLAAAWHFRQRGHLVGESVALVWLGENLFNVARYMGDARAQVLPLVGGGEHDWTEILTRWGLLHADKQLAGMLSLCATLSIVAVCVRLVRYGRQPT
jgi:hypothetical protein